MEVCNDLTDLTQFSEQAVKRLGQKVSGTLNDVKEIWELKDAQDLTSHSFDLLFTRIILLYLLNHSKKISAKRLAYIKERMEKDTTVVDSSYSLLLTRLKGYELPLNLDNLNEKYILQ